MIEFDEHAMKSIIDACIETKDKKRVASDINKTIAMVLLLSCTEKINTVDNVFDMFDELTPNEKLLFARRIYDLASTCDDITKQHKDDISKETPDENNSTK